MLLRTFMLIAALAAATSAILVQAGNAIMRSRHLAVDQALSQLVVIGHRTLTSAIVSQAAAGQTVSLPTPTPMPLCAPGASPCYSYAKFTYTAAGSSTGVTSTGGTETAYNLTQLLNDQRWVVNETVQIVETDPSCPPSGCIDGSRTVPVTFRRTDAYPYIADAGVVPKSSTSQGSSGTNTSADYAGCDGTTGCGNITQTAATPDPRSLVASPACVTNAYGGCTVSTPPPTAAQNKTFDNVDLP